MVYYVIFNLLIVSYYTCHLWVKCLVKCTGDYKYVVCVCSVYKVIVCHQYSNSSNLCVHSTVYRS